jgi:hypothetical protein
VGSGRPLSLDTNPACKRFRRMSDKQLHDEPSKVHANTGEVFVDGPDQVDVKLTPEAAEETG